MIAAAAALSDERVLLDHSPPAVAAHAVGRRYGEGDTAVDALRGVSLEVPRGQLTAVMGPSGSGKSTLMHILAGLDQPTSGSVEIAGIEITTLRDNELTKLRRRRIGFVFQFFHLLPHLTVAENVALPLSFSNRREPDRVDRLIEAVGVTDRARHRPSQLSGGEMQRTAIARALVTDPALLLADEPTGNLDSANGDALLGVITELHERGQTVVLVTHDASIASRAQRIVRMRDGRIMN